ncbi:MAG: hypothetical protein AAF721_07790 [Myxococcota bacterium]
MLRALLLVGLVSGCAGVRTTRAERAKATPAEIYRVGEARFAAGAYDEAVQLWRHAVLELPQTSDFDDLRHKLVLRMAYGQLMAWSKSGDDTKLLAAKQMLDRYLVQHETMHAEGDQVVAKRERGEVYELLYQVESRLPEPAPEPEPEPVDPTQRDLAPEPEPEPEPEETGETFNGYGDRGRVRKILVRRDRPSVDDPATRAMLRSNFADPFQRGSVSRAEVAIYHGPRAMVRTGLMRPAADKADVARRRQARKLGNSVLEAAKPGIRECYEAANARNPGVISNPTVEFTVDEGGVVTEAKVVDGTIADALGELCVLEHLEQTTIDQAVASAETIVVPLTMWVHGTVYIYEHGHRTFQDGFVDLPFNGLKPYRDPAAPPRPDESPDTAHDVN